MARFCQMTQFSLATQFRSLHIQARVVKSHADPEPICNTLVAKYDPIRSSLKISGAIKFGFESIWKR